MLILAPLIRLYESYFILSVGLPLVHDNLTKHQIVNLY